jgi:hypothetical protein
MIPFSMVKKRAVWSSCLVLAFTSASMFILTYYLPIYFQAVKGVSPSLSGVYLLPGILPQMATAYMSGVLGQLRANLSGECELNIVVGKTGYYLPWIVASTILMAIASGLLSTLAQDTQTAKWVGYEILIGIGRGCGMQMVSQVTAHFGPPAEYIRLAHYRHPKHPSCRSNPCWDVARCFLSNLGWNGVPHFHTAYLQPQFY